MKMSQNTLATSVVENIIPSVRALHPYSLKVTEARVKLNQNESPWDVPESFKQHVLERCAARAWNRYPDFYPQDVLRDLGQLHGLNESWVMVGNGSNELIASVLSAAVGSGQKVAYPIPTFTLYEMMIHAAEGVPVAVPLTDDLQYDREAFLRLADEGEAHLLLCTPNNPTGSVVEPAFVAELARRTPRLVLVDEAYVHFGHHDHSVLLKEYPNVIVLRTLSKALGLAGVRLGYALAHPSLTEHITKVKLPYNVGVFGLEVARELLADPTLADEAAQRLVRERERLIQALRPMPFARVYDGQANFVLVRLQQPGALYDALLAQGILIRNVSHYQGLAGCLRLSVGRPEENDELIAALHAWFAEEKNR